MIALICFVLAVLASLFKSKSRLEAENAVLRHQLIVLRRRVRGRAQPTNNDRWFLVQMYRWFPSILNGSHGGLSLLMDASHATSNGRIRPEGRLCLDRLPATARPAFFPCRERAAFRAGQKNRLPPSSAMLRA